MTESIIGVVPMCANYRPVTRIDRLLSYFGVERSPGELPPEEAWPTGLAPFIRLREPGHVDRVVEDGHFGLLPWFAKEVTYGRRTYNARSETVATLASFKRAWADGRRCIVPAEAIFEPCYESGHAVRWCVQQPAAVPMGIAGIYTRWRSPEGVEHHSFAMLTVNADGHPVFSRLHKPDDEKRMVVILDPAEYDRWLMCTPAEAMGFCKPWHGPLEAFAAPLPARAPRASNAASTSVVARAKPKSKTHAEPNQVKDDHQGPFAPE